LIPSLTDGREEDGNKTGVDRSEGRERERVGEGVQGKKKDM